jgi:hypothetical protein
MPITPTFPGIYILEAPASGHTVTPAPTNIAVFIGYTHPLKTPADNLDKPIEIFGFSDYTRLFGGFVRSQALADAAPWFGDMATAVNQFFLNGGSDAFVVSLSNQQLPHTGATFSIDGVVFTALEITDETWQMSVTVRPIPDTLSPPRDDDLADVIITYGSGKGAITETYRRASTDPASPNFVETKINGVSQLVTVALGSPPAFLPLETKTEVFPIALETAKASEIFDAADFSRVLQQDTLLDNRRPRLNMLR